MGYNARGVAEVYGQVLDVQADLATRVGQWADDHSLQHEDVLLFLERLRVDWGSPPLGGRLDT